MKITDLNGCLIEVTNLREAIEIARQYKEYRHEDKSFSEFDKRQKALGRYARETRKSKGKNNNN